MEGNFTQVPREKEASRAQSTVLGRLEAVVRFVFKYIILPLLLWELGFRSYYKLILGVFDLIFKILLSFFGTENGGLFNGISEDEGWYDVNSAGGSDVDAMFDEVIKEGKVGKKSDSFILRIDSRYRWVMDGIESQQIWQSTRENVDELYSIFEKADYIFDRYVKHSPFCVLKKFSPNRKKSTYEYGGIPLNKYEGFSSYLLYKRLGTKTLTTAKPKLRPTLPPVLTTIQKPAEEKPEVQNVTIIPISRLTQTETIKPAKERTVSVFNPPVFNFAASSFAQTVANEYKYTSPKRIKLDNSKSQIPSSIISKPTQDKARPSAASSKPRVINIEFANKQRSGFKLLIRPKHELSLKKPKQGIEVLSTSNTKRITKSISVDDVEYIEKIKHEIKQILPKPDYDDGSLGPVILRLAWHCCATYNKFTGNGGSNGATMRFIPEITDDGNSGLDIARSALEPIKQKYPAMTYSDLWTLAGKISIEEMGGPEIPWRCGRVDCIDDRYVPPNGRLPFAYKNANHIRETFSRMGFNDRETVLLLGAHGLGRCHKRYSGWEGKWTENPISFSNDFYKVLLDEKWSLGTVPETGKEQYYNKDKSLIMLNTDMELIRDPHFLHFVKLYSQHQATFFQDFAEAFGKLLELGIDRDSNGNVLPKNEFY
ncbi:uncharacterized protein AC631_02422 [Debaryomyces fabryi]|uniref:Peroxidase n=1 Tax=Debaryomyces fabryi TaxID=58627 RepID=A0A0V1Q049_9ASCO|nr:uncharacterized protein AC631_02422 [Debaryomyces fabryi]KSA01814.1 hypothetical protein AC631_02422 [Debaryomyces fabryi]CUM46740.1 unnamed protein product [Debaryomyces fabryi]